MDEKPAYEAVEGGWWAEPVLRDLAGNDVYRKSGYGMGEGAEIRGFAGLSTRRGQGPGGEPTGDAGQSGFYWCVGKDVAEG